ncbi:MAG TPA: TolC family protein [Caldithrix abyssi]|uniref:TolC family protein n=1 Tax=Caldithrix abyssi TaxID=187145 RepID=A0A7V4WX73_CALAY|nr:TolC family protein [Caldithrix abyssi]
MKNIYLLIFVIFLFMQISLGQDSYTLSECLRQAYESSHLLRAAKLEVLASAEQTAAARAQNYPLLNVAAVYTRIGEISTFTFPSFTGGPPRKLSFGTPNRVNADAKLQYPLFTWWRIQNSIQLAEQGERMTGLQEELQRLNLTHQVLRAYFAVLINKAVVQLLQANMDRTKKSLTMTRKRYEEGQLAKHELLRTQVQFTNEKNQLKTALGNLSNSRLFLGKVLGRPESEIDVQGELHFVPLKTGEEELVRRALEQRLELRMLDVEKAMNSSNLELAGSGNKPTLALFSSYNITNGFDPIDPEKFVDNWNVGIQFSWPLFDGFATKHKTEEARIRQKITLEKEAELRQNIILQVKQAMVTIRQMENSIASREKNIELAREVQQMSEKQYRNGLISLLDLLVAQKNLFNAELSHLQAVFNHIMAKIDLGKAIGDYTWFEEEVE